jgi:hypothetical protein
MLRRIIQIRGALHQLHSEHQRWAWGELHAKAIWALEVELGPSDKLRLNEIFSYLLLYPVYLVRLLADPLQPLLRELWTRLDDEGRPPYFQIDRSHKGDALCFICSKLQALHVKHRHKQNGEIVCICDHGRTWSLGTMGREEQNPARSQGASSAQR